ncbi:Grx4 family monothiol glutaredoxin [Amphritea sp. 1_MG-2023]|uniref:Grx4 family monothiol glutaredoxin n=1 Tax=Amphritea sp. 1_MG-2023 TaxID=3062670 RepID=UPI0026E38F59|nr:Grx4 family monothiol glutaredoxin [Amphritea sp. 1_MG-2023]MDO6564119.1 Grx4 family monothiol glutaredoxin [Amphritea sp. 1_MG-2023]
MSVVETIKEQIESNDILLYMKGTPRFPQCGFSSRASEAIMSCDARFAFVNILESPEIRAELPKYANWPTFPQLWIKGELIGGCDIIAEMAASGELKELIDSVAVNADSAES